MRHRILVVEDNQPNRELLCDWLEANGYDVASAENLQQGLAAIEEQTPDAILLDVQLGSEDGLMLARAVRQESETSRLPVIAVTAHAMISDRERMIQAGCNACVSKPIDFTVLRDQLKQWLEVAVNLQAAGPRR
jgi:two-component system cell cycle response regulator DivK